MLTGSDCIFDDLLQLGLREWLHRVLVHLDLLFDHGYLHRCYPCAVVVFSRLPSIQKAWSRITVACDFLEEGFSALTIHTWPIMHQKGLCSSEPRGNTDAVATR